MATKIIENIQTLIQQRLLIEVREVVNEYQKIRQGNFSLITSLLAMYFSTCDLTCVEFSLCVSNRQQLEAQLKENEVVQSVMA